MVRLRPREFLSRLIFHRFPIKTLPQNAKCRRSSALEFNSSNLANLRIGDLIAERLPAVGIAEAFENAPKVFLSLLNFQLYFISSTVRISASVRAQMDKLILAVGSKRG